MTIDEAISELKTSQDNTRFERLLTITGSFFVKRKAKGKKRGKGSHHVFKTRWPGDPRLNLQVGESGKAKSYQVDQVIEALEKLKGLGG